MSLKGLVRDIMEIKDDISRLSMGRLQGKRATRGGRAHIAPEGGSDSLRDLREEQSSPGANLPTELLHSITGQVEGGETSWPGRRDVVACASVCELWRNITKDIVKTPERCSCLTFPISLKLLGPRGTPIQCFIRRDRATSTYKLYLGLGPAKKIRRAMCTEFGISFVRGDFCRTGSSYVGKLSSNFLGTKFTISDSQPPQPALHSNCKQHLVQVSSRKEAINYNVGTISYELNILHTRGLRRMHCICNQFPSLQFKEGLPLHHWSSQISMMSNFHHSTSKLKQSPVKFSSTSPDDSFESISGKMDPLILKNKAPR